MKYLIAIFLLPTIIWGQVSDSLAVANHVDSLLDIAKDKVLKDRNYDQALSINLEAKNIAKDSAGQDSQIYAMTCTNRGWINIIKKDYNAAELDFQEAIFVLKKLHLTETIDYALAVYNIGLVYFYSFNYILANQYYLEAIPLFEKVFGKDHVNNINLFINTTVLFRKLGKYEDALLYCLQAKQLQVINHGKDHPQYDGIINNLANIYNDLGNFYEAEKLYIEVKDFREKVYGIEHGAYSSSLSNLSSFYNGIGQYEKAVNLQKESMAIRLRVDGPDNVEYARSCNNLGNVYKNLGRFEDGEKVFIESMRIREAVLGKDHDDYAQVCNNLANLYKQVRQFDKAELLLKESLSIYEQKYGRSHYDFALSSQNLADIYSSVGDYIKAESMYLESDSLLSAIFDVGHPYLSSSSYNLALFYERTGNLIKATDYFSKSFASNKTELSRTQSYLTEIEMDNFIKRFDERQSIVYTVTEKIDQFNLDDDRLLELCYDNALFYKGYILNSKQILNNTLGDSDNYVNQFKQLKAVRRLLGAEYMKPVASRINQNNLEESANQIEKNLSRDVLGYNDVIRQVNWREVKGVLKDGEAAIEFVKYSVFDSLLQVKSVNYAALVLIRGASAPKFVKLFEEEELDLLTLGHFERRADYVNNLYGSLDRSMVPIGRSKRPLYDIVWKKIIDEVLLEVNTVYFSPTGVLLRLNMNAIPIAEEKVLSDRLKLIQLGSTRQLVLSANGVDKATVNTAVLFGGIDFKLDTLEIDSISKISSEIASSYTGQNLENLSFNVRSSPWNYLKWTEKEVLALTDILEKTNFQVVIHTGKRAKEESFTILGSIDSSSPRIIHMATHGYFLPDPESSSHPVDSSQILHLVDNPMIRSGLILAGGNYAWENGHSFNTSSEDGIVTAYEISQMNLRNTELVILSACETGLGDIHSNEGVYGLQRAFKIAGVKHLIMSLWQVPDYQTHELMINFYTKWLIDNMPVRDALISAQNVLRDKYYDPYYWAGFVLIE